MSSWRRRANMLVYYIDNLISDKNEEHYNIISVWTEAETDIPLIGQVFQSSKINETDMVECLPIPNTQQAN